MGGPAPSVQYSWDGPGALAGGDDGKALCWDQASGRFTMVAKAAASHTHAPSDLSQGGATSGQVLAWNGSAWVATTPAAGVTDHGALTGLSDDDHSVYALLAPAASTRNVIQPTGAAIIPLVVKGATSQSAALQQWQNSAGTVLLYTSAAGHIYGPNAFQVHGSTSLQLGGYGTVQAGVNWQASTTFAAVSGNATNIGLLVKGASGMSVNIIEAQVSTGTVVARVGPTGAGLFQPSTDVAPLVLKGHASATANLQEWQSSAAAIQFAIGAGGRLRTNQAVANTNTPSGATVQAMPFYDAAGTLLGYAPLYAAPW